MIFEDFETLSISDDCTGRDGDGEVYKKRFSWLWICCEDQFKSVAISDDGASAAGEAETASNCCGLRRLLALPNHHRRHHHHHDHRHDHHHHHNRGD